MRINNEHFRKAAQIGRAGGMIWMIFITLLFEFYNLYFAQLPVYLMLAVVSFILALSSVLFYWSFKTLRRACAMPAEIDVDVIKKRDLRKKFLLVLTIEIIGFNLAPLFLLWFHHIEYIVPVEILICAIHFIPLARIFKMPIYYYLGGAVSLITILTVIFILPSSQMGNLMTLAAVPSLSFIILNLITIVFILIDSSLHFRPSPVIASR